MSERARELLRKWDRASGAVDFDADINALTYFCDGAVVAVDLKTDECYILREDFPELSAGYDNFFDVFIEVEG
jgi:hypothetical protein